MSTRIFPMADFLRFINGKRNAHLNSKRNEKQVSCVSGGRLSGFQSYLKSYSRCHVTGSFPSCLWLAEHLDYGKLHRLPLRFVLFSFF